MRLILRTPAVDAAQKYLLPRASSTSSISNQTGNALAITWDEVQVERGALESVFELAGDLSIAGVAVDVAVGFIVSWVWELLHDKPDVRIEVIISDQRATVVRVDGTSRESVAAAVTAVLSSESAPPIT